MKTKIKMIEIFNEDCLIGLKRLEDASVDVVCTDPPYLYLKHKLDRPFDEDALFAELKRVLKPNGWIVIFGRGKSFYRWGAKLDELGFTFKEEVIWDKCYNSSPLTPVMRVHETVSIWTKGNNSINKCRIPYVEARVGDLEKVVNDAKRLCAALTSPKEVQALVDLLEKKCLKFYQNRTKGSEITVTGGIKDSSRAACVMAGLTKGLVEKSIIKQVRDHYTSIHPTQKPVRLLERLLALVATPDMVVIDPFMGSGSTGIACLNQGYSFKGWEIDIEYFSGAQKRINEVCAQPKLF